MRTALAPFLCIAVSLFCFGLAAASGAAALVDSDFEKVLVEATAAEGITRNILLTGYWPPSNEMLRKFSPDPVQNPDGWQGRNWEGRGYDVYAYFPEFPGGTGSNPKGDGDFEVDYQDVSEDFWRIADDLHPVAILSYGQGAGPWEIEYNARNLSSWSNDYQSPRQPTPAPPDGSVAAGYVRHSTLPVQDIADAINDAGIGVSAWVDWSGNPGAFLCEYMAYHDAWYQSLHRDVSDSHRCLAAGFTHVASSVSVSDATAAAEIALRETIFYLDSQLGPSCGDGVPEGTEECDDGNTVDGDCCSASCTYEASGSLCGNPGDGVCDLQDTCDGAGACDDNVAPPATVCRADAGECDAEERCDGAGSCPADALEPDTTECRPAVDLCDYAEYCTGSDPECPTDMAVECDDSDPCTADSCDAIAGCDHAWICGTAIPATPAWGGTLLVTLLAAAGALLSRTRQP